MAAIEMSTDNAAKRASGSSFYIGMRLLPPPQRAAIFEIYSFCRAVDDVADDPGPRPERLAELQKWRADVDALFAGTPPPRMRGLAAPVRDFALNREDFHAIIDGMEMDVVADIRAPDWATLDLYCDRVASAVGRLCVRVFGMGRTDGIELAYHLGPRAAADQYPARSRRGCRDQPSLSAARGADTKRDHGIRAGLGIVSSEHRTGLRAGGRARAQSFRAG